LDEPMKNHMLCICPLLDKSWLWARLVLVSSIDYLDGMNTSRFFRSKGVMGKVEVFSVPLPSWEKIPNDRCHQS